MTPLTIGPVTGILAIYLSADRSAPWLMWNTCPSITSAGTDFTPDRLASLTRCFCWPRCTTSTSYRCGSSAAATDRSALTHTGHPA